MPFTRWGRHPYLTPPALWTFVISVVLALVAVAATYLHFTLLREVKVNSFVILLVAYLVLVAGVVFRGI